MKICTSTIPFSGMKIDAPIQLDSLNNRLKTAEDEGSIVFTSAPMADLTLTRTHGGILVKGLLVGTCQQVCSTCADPVSHEVSAHIDWILQTTSDRAGPDDEIEDTGVIVYEGDHVDLEDPLQEALILNLSPFWHPPRDRQDRCTACGRDCSKRVWEAGAEKSPKKTTSFGDLFKDAMKKQKN
jgi:uncharacterized metal-binding protein YceD (DUF177 family)